MRLEDMDGWANFFLGVFVSMIAGFASFLGVKQRVTTLEKEMTVLKTDLREDIKSVAERAEARHREQDERHKEMAKMMRVVVMRLGGAHDID